VGRVETACSVGGVGSGSGGLYLRSVVALVVLSAFRVTDCGVEGRRAVDRTADSYDCSDCDGDHIADDFRSIFSHEASYR
jgi:hypothetical protein